LLAWLRNFVAACGLAPSTAAYNGGFGVSNRFARNKHKTGIYVVVLSAKESACSGMP